MSNEYKHFTEEQIRELETIFGLERRDYLPIRDGVVVQNQQAKVWWHCIDGPEEVEVHEHWLGIKNYPHLYSYAKPKVKVIYKD